ncbi:MAG: CsbD family protein [Pyrinomonadaceae bacterium]|nr:CsbD family protein [Pyrinomonadaceae bacterium]
MSTPNRDEMEGKWDKTKGAVKENVGRAIGDRDMEDEGAADRASGNVQEGFGEAKRKIGDTVKDVGDAIRK